MRINQVLVLIFFLGSSYCCSNRPSTNEDWYKNEDEIISQLFWELIKPMPPFFPKDTTKEAIKIFENDLQKWIVDNRFQLYLKDSLKRPEKSVYRKSNINADFDRLSFNLFNDSLMSSRTINISGIPVRNNFKIYTNILDYDNFNEKIKDPTFLGVYEFSHIVFNATYTKACFYFSEVRGPESGGGLLIFAEKENSKWIIIHRILAWVS